MSVWSIGRNELSEEAQAFKNKLASKESQIAAQQNEILKQASELAELKATLGETRHKLNHEATRAVALESNLAKCSEDLRNEAIAAQNTAAALAGAQEKLRAKDLEIRHLESTLESISHNSETFNARGAQLEKEKGTLAARVRELEGNLRQLSSPAPPTATPGRQRAAARSRSSSVSDTRVIVLEQELKGTQASLAQKETELRAATGKLAQVQNDLVKVDNEKTALDKRLHAEIRALRTALQEKSDDLEFLKEQGNGGGREDDLLKRIDEDDAKIAALERLLRDSSETEPLKEQLRQVQQKLLVESERVLDMESQHIDLVREREEALDRAEGARAQVNKLAEALRHKAAQMESQKEASAAATAPILAAVERLRVERDNLRRDLDFLQAEAKFRGEALEAKIVALSTVTPDAPVAVVDTEEALQQRLGVVTEREHEMLCKKSREIRRLQLATMASAVVIGNLRSREDMAAERLLSASTTSANALEDAGQRLRDSETKFGIAREGLEATTRERDGVIGQLEAKESEWTQELERAKAAHQVTLGERDELMAQLETRAQELDRAKAAHQETQDRFEDLDAQFTEMSQSMEDLESERDSLTLQVTNLINEVAAAQEELAEAETRYSSLQFHQLASMSSNEATRALREQIEEMELRVMRRTEQIGIHQHDIRRLETNLKLQEERLSEMTSEMELIVEQKDAMVEDCADAREARDAAIARVEGLEVEAEALEARLEDSNVALQALVGVVFQAVGRSRDALRTLGNQLERLHEPVESIDWEARVEELENKLQDLQLVISNMEASHQVEIQKLNEEKERLSSSDDLESELARLKIKHVEEMGLLQGRLVEATSALEEAQTRYEASEANYLQLTADSARSKQELESAASDAASEVERLRSEISRIRDEGSVATHRLREQVESAVAEAQRAQSAHQELEIVHQRTAVELAQTRERSENSLQQLEDRVAELDFELREQTAQYECLVKDAQALRQQLQQETGEREQEQQEHDAALQDARERFERAESVLAQVSEELTIAADELAQVRVEAESSQEEKTTLQEELTALQAEIQRSLSVRRYLENQAKENEQAISSLANDLENVKAQYARADKSGKAAEVNLSLQSAQHRREMAEMQQQLAALRSRPNLDGIVAELEERNNEMEELLKHKCAEIEENDDRAIEMLKNNKKLAAKVETLTRKVQNLQTKLAAAKASNPTSSNVDQPRASPAVPAPTIRQRSNTLSSAIPPVPPLPSFVPASPVRSNRVASGSALPRPKTPERKALPQVFRAQTPERRITVSALSSAAPVLGQKRRAPDDFEDIHLPAQGFTPDSLPRDDENGTPRVRRMPSGIHSGFTPVRQTVRATVPSPKRAAARSSPFFSDVTNSPRLEDTTKSKRSWLGKIRGNSQPRAASSRAEL